MAYSAGKTAVKHRRYKVYARAQASYTAPTNLSGVAALRSGATLLGEFQDKSVKYSVKPNVKEDLNDGTAKVMEWLGHFEANHRNNSQANIQHIETNFDDKDVDIFLDDTVNEVWVAIKNINLQVEEEDTSGDVNNLKLQADKKVASKTVFREITDYSAFV